MKRQNLVIEIKEGECQECGMIGLLISQGNKEVCEDCEKDLFSTSLQATE